MNIKIAFLSFVLLIMLGLLLLGVREFYISNRIDNNKVVSAVVIDKYRGNKLFEGYVIRYIFLHENEKVFAKRRVIESFWREIKIGDHIDAFYDIKGSKVVSRLGRTVDATKWTYISSLPVWFVAMIILVLLIKQSVTSK